jgi:hypothetical protein
MTSLILAMLLGCSTRVGVSSTAATDKIQVVRGSMPMANAPLQGTIVASGQGFVQSRTSYVVGRKFWAVVEAEDGTQSVTKIKNQAKGGPIVSCVATVLAWPAAIGCLYVSGPSTTTQVTSPARPSSKAE